jgi:hypothetical protein
MDFSLLKRLCFGLLLTCLLLASTGRSFTGGFGVMLIEELLLTSLKLVFVL